jgi:hypothetical protein
VLSARNAPRVNVNSIDFAINAGVVVPSHVNVVAVSAFPALIDVIPDFRDDNFFVVDDEIVVLDRSRRVVDVVPAGPRTHFSQNFSRSSVGGGAAASLNLSTTEIREVQQVLIDRGFLTGQVDGVFNDRTRQALISFQRREGIQASGSIDSRTVSSLGLSNKIGQQSNQSTSGSQSTTVGQGQSGTQQNTTGQGNGQANAPAPQNQSTTGQAGGQSQGGAAQQPSAQQQPPAQQNTQAAPQNQSTVGQSGNQPAANQNTQSGQASPPPSTSGQGNAPPPAQSPGQNPGR